MQAPTVGSALSGTVERTPEPAQADPSTAQTPAAGEERPLAPPPRATAGAADAVTVRRGDTLYEIAERLARGSAADASQVMVGLYRANPEAFGASMNDLRAGAVLRVPDLAELAALPPSRVASEVDRAVAVWRNRSGAPAQAADPGGRLRLVAPSEVSVGTGGGEPKTPAGKGSDSPATTGSGAAPARAAETLEQRVVRIEQQLLEKERMLEVTSAQLAELQAKGAAAPAAEAGGLVGTLRALFGKAWWSWALLLLAVLALVGVLMAARRRAAAAEAELQAWASAPRREPDAPAPMPVPSQAIEPLIEPLIEPAAPEAAPVVDDFEGDPPIIEEAGSKIDLARAFIEMGDPAAARAELEAALRTGNEAQREEAQRLLDTLA